MTFANTPAAAQSWKARIITRSGMPEAVRTHQPSIRKQLESWIASDDFSCLGARASIRRNAIEHAEPGPLGSQHTTPVLHEALARFVEKSLTDSENFAAFVAIFNGPLNLSEYEFEELMWQQLRDLHVYDSQRYDWCSEVDRDPSSPSFSFSVAGHPFFIVGMHGRSSRISRCFPLPALAFNCHRQFRRLHQSGIYAGLRRRIREREMHLQRSINPNLADYGEDSEAKQYSGRAVEPEWVCRFSFEDVSASASPRMEGCV